MCMPAERNDGRVVTDLVSKGAQNAIPMVLCIAIERHELRQEPNVSLGKWESGEPVLFDDEVGPRDGDVGYWRIKVEEEAECGDALARLWQDEGCPSHAILTVAHHREHSTISLLHTDGHK